MVTTATGFTRTVALNVEAAMRAVKHTPHSLSLASGMARMTLGRRLTGASPFTVAELELLAPHLDTTVEALMRAEAA